ncbi:hypothetical protein CTAYLR_007839 [Chrysophaeum taylorii]|uniref:GPR180/TMEM145 transmembrane domain-containing protein n=1 Tax=Chrysophaeum taylorii TaxID=2483200 RepID=A0AAD7XJX9_9STRA|nr:hypothetical protein CTAYLR_007839 [Chrysophaeum taylorii]
MLVVVVVLFVFKVARAYDTGWRSVKKEGPWIFLERFCLDKRSRYELEARGGSLLVYEGLDTFRHMYKASYSTLPLGDRVEVAKWRGNNTDTRTSGKPRFLFVVGVSFDDSCACNRSSLFCDVEVANWCAAPTEIEYRFRFRNGNSEFGYDEIAVFPASIAFFCVECAVAASSIVARRLLAARRKLHFSARMLNESIMFEWVSQLLRMGYYAAFAHGGAAPSLLLVSSRVSRLVADLEIVILFLILAKGWTIVRRKLSAFGRLQLAILSTTYAIVSFVAFSWSLISYDPAVATFPYDGPPGTFFAVIRCFAAVWFISSVNTTLRDGSKVRFFEKLRLLGATWLLWPPFVILVVANLAPAVTRASVFFVFDTAGFVGAQLALVIMYNPATTTFPFHEMTTARTLGLQKKGKKTPGSNAAMNIMAAQRRLSNNRNVFDGKLVIDDEEERAHLGRVARVNKALLDRVSVLARLSVDLHDALALVAISPQCDIAATDEIARWSGGPEPNAKGRLESRPRHVKRPFTGPRTLLDDAIDDTLPVYAAARRRMPP